MSLLMLLFAAWALLWLAYGLVGAFLHLCLLPLHIERWHDRRRR